MFILPTKAPAADIADGRTRRTQQVQETRQQRCLRAPETTEACDRCPYAAIDGSTLQILMIPYCYWTGGRGGMHKQMAVYIVFGGTAVWPSVRPSECLRSSSSSYGDVVSGRVWGGGWQRSEWWLKTSCRYYKCSSNCSGESSLMIRA